jgi:hypothetical protein
MIPDADRLALAVLCLPRRRREALEAILGVGLPMTCAGLAEALRRDAGSVKRDVDRLRGEFLVQRIYTSWPRSYMVSDSVPDLLRRIPSLQPCGCAMGSGIRVLAAARDRVSSVRWPSCAGIAEDTGLHRRTVQTWIARLKLIGLCPGCLFDNRIVPKPADLSGVPLKAQARQASAELAEMLGRAGS